MNIRLNRFGKRLLKRWRRKKAGSDSVIWDIKPIKKDLFKDLKKEFHPVIAKMLSARYDNMDQIREVLDTKEHDPFLYKDMRVAIDLLRSAKKVMILTDFDCDGIGSNAVLSKGFEYVGIPYYAQTGSRADGYGFHPKHVDIGIVQGCDTIITADVGITNKEAVDYAISKGLKVIITDHHHPKQQKMWLSDCKSVIETGQVKFELQAKQEMVPVLPNAHAILNPWVSGETYPYGHHTGVGIAYKVIQALCPKMDDTVKKELIEIVTLSTVTDVGDITGENRCWIKQGMKYLENPTNPGLSAIGELQGLQAEVKKNGFISIRTINFGLGPCFNANSRIEEDGEIGRKLLMTKDNDIAKVLAKELYDANQERKKIQDKMVRRCKKEEELLKDRVIVISHKDNHPAVCGICASKIVDATGHPTIILNEGSLKGSGRSTDRINLFKILESVPQSLFKGWGGHTAAAGLTLNCSVDEFRKAVNEVVKDYPAELFEPVLSVDCEVQLQDLTYELMDQIHELEPFGKGNPTPKFYVVGKPMYDGIELIESKKDDLNGKHVRVWLEGVGDDQGRRKAMGWNLGDKVKPGRCNLIETVFTPSLNSYPDKQGVTKLTIQLSMRDIRVS